MEENQKKEKFKITDLYKNKQYYAIINLVFYSIIILILIIGVRSNSSQTSKEDSIKINRGSQTTNVEGFKSIKNKNFEFEYTLSVDNNTVIYKGKQYKNKIDFTDNINNHYMVQDDIFIKKDSDKSVLVDSPLKYFNYLNVDIIEKIVAASKKDENDQVISLNEFLPIIKDNYAPEYKYDDDVFITITKNNGIITEITFDITNFVNLDNADIKNAKLSLKYSNFGLVDNFDIK